MLLLVLLLVSQVQGDGLSCPVQKKGIFEMLMEEVDSLKETISVLKKELRLLKTEFVDRRRAEEWHLAMNLNPADGHIMGYLTGWNDGNPIGTRKTAFSKDFLDQTTWNLPVNYIAIVRHHQGMADAIKVWKFAIPGQSVLTRFKTSRSTATDVKMATIGGPLQVNFAKHARNLADDPIFALQGDLIFNFRNAYNGHGHRILMSTSYLPADPNIYARGIGNNFFLLSGDPLKVSRWAHEISNIQACQPKGCPTEKVSIQGIDHGTGSTLKSGPVYGNYAIYVSAEAARFPIIESSLSVEMDSGYLQ